MLSITGRRMGPFCDRRPRRHFLKIGGLALGGLALPQILRAEAASDAARGASQSHKAIIMIYLPGGPPHLDMFDMKRDAPDEIRGPLRPIRTNVPGIEICEYLPRLAEMMDKFAIIRSLHDSPEQHASDYCMSGFPVGPKGRQDHHPSLGSVLSKLQGPVDPGVPPFVGLTIKMPNNLPWENPGLPGFLGLAHAAFQPESEGMADMRLAGVTLDRLGDRRALLAGLDRFRRHLDAAPARRDADAFTRQAFDVLTSSKLIEAMDLEREDPAVRDRYGRGSSAQVSEAGPHWMDQFLMARRLVEAGVRCVTLSFGAWDYHSANFQYLPGQLLKFDQGITALVADLHTRGLENDVSVVAWGEFGRTPRINYRGSPGRDHWPPASCALLAGGGMRMGQVIGSTNRLGEVPQDRPLHYQDVFATLYRQVGIDVATATLIDQSGRPQYVLDRGESIRELV